MHKSENELKDYLNPKLQEQQKAKKLLLCNYPTKKDGIKYHNLKYHYLPASVIKELEILTTPWAALPRNSLHRETMRSNLATLFFYSSFFLCLQVIFRLKG